MNGIPSSLGVFLYAIIAFVLFTGIPLVRFLIKRHNKARKENEIGE